MSLIEVHVPRKMLTMSVAKLSFWLAVPSRQSDWSTILSGYETTFPTTADLNTLVERDSDCVTPMFRAGRRFLRAYVCTTDVSHEGSGMERSRDAQDR